ncbi:MAG: DUF1365 domain-containing protein [Gemmatimonadales bacterium]
MNSAIYTGLVRHRRLRPHPHAFRYRVFMMYLDLHELPDVLDGRWLWSARRAAPAWFRRADYHGDPDMPLDEAVRRTVLRETGVRPAGPIRLLTHLRYFGYCFNPVSFYYCYDARDARVEAVVAEITNTPWKERHAYVLPRTPAMNGVLRFRFGKAFHVSPFMPMDHQYDWRFAEPGRKLGVHMENFDARGKIFDATLSLVRREISGPALARLLLAYPLMTASVAWAIHWNALKIWLKGNPVHTHPAKRSA